MAGIDRLLTRFKATDESVDAELADELFQTVSDRLCLRLHATELPDLFVSIAVDATVKMWRRIYFEGISSEGLNNSQQTDFVDDILDEYSAEINAYVADTAATGGAKKVVHFL